MTDKGLNSGRRFATKICATADAFVASAPSPYTVSVGNATSLPTLRRLTAVAMLASEMVLTSIMIEKMLYLCFR